MTENPSLSSAFSDLTTALVADVVRQGRTLRDQLRFDEYLRRRAADRSYTFRQHLRLLGGAIEE